MVGAKKKPYPPGTYRLDQIPNVDGAIVAIDPHTGRVLAMSGGYSSERSQFNRATQAARQPGSAIKPFVYLAALEAGYTPATLVLDAPFVINIPGRGKWKPANYSGKIYGPSPMRLGLEKSRNLMTVRLAEHIGIGKVIETAGRFGLGEEMRPELGAALGTGEVTLLDITSAYAMLANGGLHVEPTFFDSVQDRRGRIIFRHDDRPCGGCSGGAADPSKPPELPDVRERVAEPMKRYQIVSMLEGVVERGTARRLRLPSRPFAGKTGTTNDSFDAWFVGFSSNLAVGVYVGFDQPRTLGGREAGGSAAGPIFKDFMKQAWAVRPGAPFKVPSGMEFVRVSRKTGLPPSRGDRDVVLEAFIPGTQPQSLGPVIGGGLATGRPAPTRVQPGATNVQTTAQPARPQAPPQTTRKKRRRKLGRVY
jgi:penicillin-binding protein 1A